MTDSTTRTPNRVYSKSADFYVNTKNDFFDDNDSLLIKAERQNEFYNQQPLRVQCKICNHTLSTGSDFLSHQVRYVFCDNCSHLNGAHEDTKSFVDNLYIQNDGAVYAESYIDTNFVNRAEHIYVPKLNFLRANLPAGVQLKLLDVGCGAGYFVYAALLKGFDARGLDVNQTMVDFGNQQISHLLKQNPLSHASESDFFKSISNSDATVISAIGVIEHLRDPNAFIEAFHRSEAQYLFYSVPMFSFSVMVEQIFSTVYPRQLSGDHTHLFTEQSIDWLHQNRKLNVLAEWRFGTDMMDLYRSMVVDITQKGASPKLASFLNEGLGKNIDELQSVLDRNHFCSEIHCLVAKR